MLPGRRFRPFRVNNQPNQQIVGTFSLDRKKNNPKNKKTGSSQDVITNLPILSADKSNLLPKSKNSYFKRPTGSSETVRRCHESLSFCQKGCRVGDLRFEVTFDPWGFPRPDLITSDKRNAVQNTRLAG